MRFLSDYPSLVAEWHPIRNGDPVTRRGLRTVPLRASGGSARRGPTTSGWRRRTAARHSGTAAPFCAGRRVSSTNSLAAGFPAIAEEWHPSRNESLTPDGIVAGSTRVVWWRCPRGEEHVWAASPRQRTRDLSGCPFCRNLRVSRTNSLGGARAGDRRRVARIEERDVLVGRASRVVATSVVEVQARLAARVVRGHRVARPTSERLPRVCGETPRRSALACDRGTRNREGVAPREKTAAWDRRA